MLILRWPTWICVWCLHHVLLQYLIFFCPFSYFVVTKYSNWPIMFWKVDCLQYNALIKIVAMTLVNYLCCFILLLFFNNLRSFSHYFWIITLLPFFIEMLQYDWLWSGHMIIKKMFHIPMKLKSALARASMTTSDVNNQWRSNFQQQII